MPPRARGPDTGPWGGPRPPPACRPARRRQARGAGPYRGSTGRRRNPYARSCERGGAGAGKSLEAQGGTMHDDTDDPLHVQHLLDVLTEVELQGAADRELPVHDSAILLAAYVEHLVDRGQTHDPDPGAFELTHRLDEGHADV
ncbi:DUF6269 family protein [Streptomyces atacamensis]|uniref:DUF6269 family protein n=1 Tax=Streptomyces atacamensis TaxID=531966 RepID=UPI00399D2C1D